MIVHLPLQPGSLGARGELPARSRSRRGGASAAAAARRDPPQAAGHVLHVQAAGLAALAASSFEQLSYQFRITAVPGAPMPARGRGMRK